MAASAVVRPAPRRVAAQGRGPLTGALDSGFAAIPSALAFGPPVDVAAGWDGTLWGIDTSGAPSVYDPVAQAWQVFGGGIDAVAYGTSPGAAPAPAGPTPTAQISATPTPAATATPAPQTTSSAGAPTDDGDVVRVVLAGVPPQQGAPSPTPAPPNPIPLGTAAPERTATPQATPSHTATAPAGATASATPSRTATGTGTPGPTNTPGPTSTPRATDTPGPSATPGASRTAAPRPGAGAAPTGLYFFRGPEVLYLPVAGQERIAPPATATAAPVQTLAREAATTVVETPAPPAPAGVAGPAGTATLTTPPSPGPDAAAALLASGTPQPIAAVWPHLPPSFQQGVTGAASVDGALYLFTAGRYVRADGTAPPAKLSAVPGWPQSPGWRDGLFDLVFAGVGDTAFTFVRGDETVQVDPTIPIAAGPLSATILFGSDLLGRLQAGGVDALLLEGPLSNVPNDPVRLFQGPGLVEYATSQGPAGPAQYVAQAYPQWPAVWHPVLQHAPSGRVGALWAATTSDAILTHDGEAWTQAPGGSPSVAAGQDGSVFAVGSSTSAASLYQWDAGAGAWRQVAQHSGPLAQVAVGDASRVWVRDSGNAVRQFQGGQLGAVPQLDTAAHLAANADGTVWHCDGSRASAFRFISEAAAPSQAIPAAGAVRKVASTGFGAAHVLVGQGAQAQVYRYDSPYVFKTSASYPLPEASVGVIEQGLGTLYLNAVDDPDTPQATTYLVALDAHTGQERSRSAAVALAAERYSPPVFDPLQEAVYVILHSPISSSVGGTSRLLALDARDLATVRWSFSVQGRLEGQAALSGTQLACGDSAGNLYLFDARVPPGTTPAPRWVRAVAPGITQGPVIAARVLTPVLANGAVYAPVWANVFVDNNQEMSLFLARCSAADGSGLVVQQTAPQVAPPDDFDSQVDFPPVLGQATSPTSGKSAPALFVVGGNFVCALFLDQPGATQPLAFYALPNRTSRISSGLGYGGLGGGGLWFGDWNGLLYGVDAELKPLPNTPRALGSGTDVLGITTTPVVTSDSKGGTAVFAAWVTNQAAGSGGLLAFDPASGNVTSVATGQTVVGALSRSVTQGVVYAAGTSTGLFIPQVFGIRADAVVQGLRDFVVESQLMQDFDPAPAGQSQPSNTAGTARYQTHLTVVDDTKAPLPRTPVKIWADTPTTLLVNGQTFPVGPGDGESASATAGADGVVTIVSGDVKGDGSDKADMYAPALRIWAPFMNPYERLVVLPDREFHNRVATAHATAAGQPGADDPTRVNLQTCQRYGPVQRGGAPSGPTLFTAQEEQQGQPQNVAGSIQQTTAGIGQGSAAAGAVRGRALRATRVRGGTGARAVQTWVRKATATPGAPYLAYADMPGARYSPTNTPTVRPVAVVQPVGFSFSSDATRSTPPSLSALAPADAAAAIDALQGVPWEQSVHAPAHVRAAAAQGLRVGSWWTDFWDWLTGVVAEITHIIVSVAEEVYAGIRLIVNGIAYVFRQIIHAIEEVAAFIGSIFKELEKLIEDVIEALSILFQFGEILKTHNLIKAELLNRINGVSGNPAYPGFAASITGTAKGTLDTLVEGLEGDVTAAFDTLADRIAGAGSAAGGAVPLTGLKGGGATAHTVFTVTPKGGGQPSSHAPQATWALQRLKGGAGGAAGSVSLAGRATAAGSGADALAAVFDTFASRLSNDTQLSGQWDRVRNGFQTLGTATSAGDFLREGVAELLRLLGLLVAGALAVADAFLDGLLAAAAALVQFLFDPQTGLLNTELEIPVLSWLYRLLFGEPLTFVNVLSLVVAIPVTILWRIVEGQWPSQSVPAGGATAAGARAGGAPPLIQRLMAYAGAIITVCLGFVLAVGDAEGEGDVPVWVGRVALAGSFLGAACAFPLLTATAPGPYDWADWAVALGAGALNILGSLELADGSPAQKILTYLSPALLSALSLAQLGVFIAQFVKDTPPDPVGEASLGIGIAATVPGIVNPAKLFGEELALLVAALDVVMGFAAGIMQLVAALEAG